MLSQGEKTFSTKNDRVNCVLFIGFFVHMYTYNYVCILLTDVQKMEQCDLRWISISIEGKFKRGHIKCFRSTRWLVRLQCGSFWLTDTVGESNSYQREQRANLFQIDHYRIIRQPWKVRSCHGNVLSVMFLTYCSENWLHYYMYANL
jgi:hypothetical protein